MLCSKAPPSQGLRLPWLTCIRVYQVLPKEICRCPDHNPKLKKSHKNRCPNRQRNVGLFIPGKIVPTWRIRLDFTPVTLLMAPLPSHTRPVIDGEYKTVIVPWYNTNYPYGPKSRQPASTRQHAKMKEWPMSQQRPRTMRFMDAIVGRRFWKVPYALDSHVLWGRDVQDGNKGK